MPSYIPPHRRRPSGVDALQKGSTPIPPNKREKELSQIADILEENSLNTKAHAKAIQQLLRFFNETVSQFLLPIDKAVREEEQFGLRRDKLITDHTIRISALERRLDRMQNGLKLAAAEVTTKNDDRHTEKSIKRLQQGLKLAATDAPTKKKSKRRRKRSKAKSRRRSRSK